MSDPTIEPEWLRGALPFLTLSALATGPSHGYAVAAHLERNGLTGLRTGTLYPVLNRLEGDGMVAAQWLPGEGGPGRKVYSLTPEGHRRLDVQRAGWRLFTDRVAASMQDTGA